MELVENGLELEHESGKLSLGKRKIIAVTLFVFEYGWIAFWSLTCVSRSLFIPVFRH